MKKLWFKTKLYGWGWYPATWQGMLILIGYVILFTIGEILFINTFLPQGITPQPLLTLLYFLWLVAITAILISICYRTGEKPRWRWGK